MGIKTMVFIKDMNVALSKVERLRLHVIDCDGHDQNVISENIKAKIS